MENDLNIAIYGEGILYPPNLENNLSSIKDVGWTSLMVSLFQVSETGDISINGTTIISNGTYTGDASWPQQLAGLKNGGTLKTLLATFGGWDSAFQNIQDIYNNNNNSFSGTQLEANSKVFRSTFPAFDLIDMDVEYPDGKPSNAQAAFIAFCEMWIEAGFGITFCPYEDQSFWVNSLVAIESNHPGAVKWWNLQCYAGGAGNQPQDWANAILAQLPTFNVDGYILASDWSRFWNSQYKMWQGDCPSAMQSYLGQFKGQKGVGGGFIWTLDQIVDYTSETAKHPDPATCAKVTVADYYNAVKNALS
ncbi:MAG: hypothetical protein CL843_07345 [Crocinitomicaceae bacterium]|nr:hypothetical protein [Crocinitomicaceae bacterium]|tara:strand:+ start:1169 stop:2086 length:918 start_codon:yes stop_codon:yes gene_type:complete